MKITWDKKLTTTYTKQMKRTFMKMNFLLTITLSYFKEMSGGCQSIIKGHEKFDARIVNN